MPIVAQLAITMDEKTNVTVTGPVDQTMLCLGLLEMAKTIVVKRADKSENRIMEVPPGTVLKVHP